MAFRRTIFYDRDDTRVEAAPKPIWIKTVPRPSRDEAPGAEGGGDLRRRSSGDSGKRSVGGPYGKCRKASPARSPRRPAGTLRTNSRNPSRHYWRGPPGSFGY